MSCHLAAPFPPTFRMTIPMPLTITQIVGEFPFAPVVVGPLLLTVMVYYPPSAGWGGEEGGGGGGSCFRSRAIPRTPFILTILTPNDVSSFRFWFCVVSRCARLALLVSLARDGGLKRRLDAEPQTTLVLQGFVAEHSVASLRAFSISRLAAACTKCWSFLDRHPFVNGAFEQGSDAQRFKQVRYPEALFKGPPVLVGKHRVVSGPRAFCTFPLSPLFPS